MSCFVVTECPWQHNLCHGVCWRTFVYSIFLSHQGK